MRKIFIEDLPKWESGKNKGGINWIKSAEIKSKIKFIYEDIEGEVQIISCEKDYLYIKYLNNDLYKITIDSFKLCGFGKLLKKITNEFKVNIGYRFKDNKRDITIIDRQYRKDKHNINRKWYRYNCNKCGFCDDRSWIVEGSLLNGVGCSVCGSNSKNVVEHINSITAKEETMWMIDYFQGGYDEAKLYTPQCGDKIYPICPYCKRVKDIPMRIQDIYKYHSIGCICGDGISYPEKIMFNILEQLLGSNFIYQYNPIWARPRRYDFYFELDNKNYIIEMDGGLGHGNEPHTECKLTKEELVEIDTYKDKLAYEHTIQVIRINCVYRYTNKFEYIKNSILKSKLRILFDLDNIDWARCESFALSNLAKFTCELKKDNPSWTTTKISEVVGLSRVTINNYLKQGNQLGWCNYNPSEEMSKRCYSLGKSTAKPIEIYKDGIKLNYPPFDSATELSRQSEELLGVKLTRSGIGRVCRGERTHHKGYFFKYVD